MTEYSAFFTLKTVDIVPTFGITKFTNGLSQVLLTLPDVPRFSGEDKSPDGNHCELVAELEGLGVVWAIKHF